MGFLWQLLPGAREARNQVILGYTWLLAIGLWFGVPSAPKQGNFAELLDAVGGVGVGVALSFVAFLLGSVFEDASAKVIRFGGKGPSTLVEFIGDNPMGLQRLAELEIRSEVERLQAALDRLSAELKLRVGLIVPAIPIGAAAAVGHWQLGIAVGVGILALLWQLILRRQERERVDNEMAQLQDIYLRTSSQR